LIIAAILLITGDLPFIVTTSQLLLIATCLPPVAVVAFATAS